jgi:hypothetical protein
VESVTVFDCSVTLHTPREDFIWEWEQLAERVARELHQDCVYLEIDGVVIFVKP